MRTHEKEFYIKPTSGGVSVFVPIAAETLTARTAQELLIKAQQALLTYLAALSTEQLPVIA